MVKDGHWPLSEYLRNGVWIFLKAIFVFLGLIEQQIVHITWERGKSEVRWIWIGQISDLSCADVDSGSARVMHNLA